MGLEGGRDGRDQWLQCVARQAGQIQERRGALLHVAELYMRHGRCLLFYGRHSIPQIVITSDYLERNKAYLVHYEEWAKEQKTYTSQVAESHIESIINARHNKSGKMQWTRAGAHKVLQIRGVMTSNEWEDRWQAAVLSALKVAA